MAALLDLDLGDIVGVSGPLVRTRRGELSIAVDEATLLAKALRPPPDKHAGLRDPETRYRQRYLDLMSDADVREVFVVRSRAIAGMRRFLDGARVHRGRDAHPAADLRRGRGAARS